MTNTGYSADVADVVLAEVRSVPRDRAEVAEAIHRPAFFGTDTSGYRSPMPVERRLRLGMTLRAGEDVFDQRSRGSGGVRSGADSAEGEDAVDQEEELIGAARGIFVP
jgi:hypothetical protein